VRVLDKLLAAAEGRPLQRKSILPIGPEECDEVKDLLAKVASQAADLTVMRRQADKMQRILARVKKRSAIVTQERKRSVQR
jgi:hypothetical protein